VHSRWENTFRFEPGQCSIRVVDARHSHVMSEKVSSLLRARLVLFVTSYRKHTLATVG
jgi:hypothetical protein